jgi:hypothetical protein
MMNLHKKIVIIAIFMVVSTPLYSTGQPYLIGQAMAKHQTIDCRVVLDRVSLLNQLKRFSIGIWETFIYYASRSRLEGMRKAYNNAYGEILVEYTILPFNSSESLDTIWADVVKQVTRKYRYILWIYGPIAMTRDAWGLYKVKAFANAKTLCYESHHQ